MKVLLGLIILAAIGVGIYLKYPSMTASSKQPSGVRIGASVEEVEKVLGKPVRVLPSFGRENRVYKAQSGKTYMLIFERDELIEIH